MFEEDGMEYIPMNGIESAMQLATKIVYEQNKNPKMKMGSGIMAGVRETTQCMVICAALVSLIQDPDNPVFKLRTDEEDTDVQPRCPSEILREMADSWDETMAEVWEETSEMFVAGFRQVIMEMEMADFPEDFTVSDILGEAKNDS